MTSQPPQPRPPGSRLVSDAILIAAVPALGYAFSFCFEAGFARAFHIPLLFITVGPTTVFIAAGSTLFIAVTLLIVADMIASFAPKTQGPVSRLLGRLFPMFLFALAYCLSVLGTPLASTIWAFAAPWAFILFLDFVFPLITQRGKGSYAAKLTAQAEHDAHFTGLLGIVSSRLGGLYMLIVYIGIALLATFYVGEGQAMRQRQFLVTEGPRPQVVLRSYGDTLVLAPLDTTARNVQTVFTLAPLTSPGIQPLHLLETGPLMTAPIPAAP